MNNKVYDKDIAISLIEDFKQERKEAHGVPMLFEQWCEIMISTIEADRGLFFIYPERQDESQMSASEIC